MNGARTRADLGVFGGTFNPIHSGHLRAAEEAAEALELSQVLFVPSARPPHKRDDEAIAPAEQRLAWLRLALAGNPRFALDALELERPGPSYLIDTLRALGARHGRERLTFLLGRDAFAELSTWHEPRALLASVDFAVLSRPPLREGSLADWLPAALADALTFAPDGRSAVHREAGTRLQGVEITALDISASEIRARLREGRSVRYLLPDAVREAVIASGAYGAGVSCGARPDPGSPDPGSEWRR